MSATKIAENYQSTSTNLLYNILVQFHVLIHALLKRFYVVTLQIFFLIEAFFKKNSKLLWGACFSLWVIIEFLKDIGYKIFMFLKINNQVFVKREKSHRAADLMMTQMLQSL